MRAQKWADVAKSDDDTIKETFAAKGKCNDVGTEDEDIAPRGKQPVGLIKTRH